MTIGRANIIASLWGFAEATLFFIVPDVLLSWLALRSPKSGLIACLFALLGALIGGSAMWLWGRNDPDSARAIFELLPAMGGNSIASVQIQLADSGIAALFRGPLGGLPTRFTLWRPPTSAMGLRSFSRLASLPD